MQKMETNDNVKLLHEKYRQQLEDAKKGGGGTPPGGTELEARVAALEKAIPDIRERLARVETKLDNIEKTMVNKSDIEALRGAVSADLQKTVSDATWRFVQISVVLAGLAFTAAKFIGH